MPVIRPPIGSSSARGERRVSLPHPALLAGVVSLLAGCGEDSFLGLAEGQPCSTDLDCPVFASCNDGACSYGLGGSDAGATRDGGVAQDVGGSADAGGRADASLDAGADTPGASDAGGADGPADELWRRFGTRGSTTGLVNRQAECDARSVRTDDLRTGRNPMPPGNPPWGTGPIEDEVGYCGTDSETLGWRLMNCERITREIPPMRCDLRLVWTARSHSADMIENSYFDHTDQSGGGPSDRMEARGVTNWNRAGENISTYPDAEAAHLSWMESDGHRENILFDEFLWVGQGEAEGGSSSLMSTQLFARFFSDG